MVSNVIQEELENEENLIKKNIQTAHNQNKEFADSLFLDEDFAKNKREFSPN